MVNQRRNGFSMIEMLVVVSIVVVLATILLPSFTAARMRARYVRWAGFSKNLRTDQRAFIYYNFENQGSGGVLWNQSTGEPYKVAQKAAALPEHFNARFMEDDTNVHSNPDALWVDGRWRGKGAIEFNGVNEWLRANFHQDARIRPEQFTMFLSIRPWAVDDQDGIIGMGTNLHNEPDGWYFRLRAGADYTLGANLKGDADSTENLELNEWTQATVTYDGDDIRWYIAGEQTDVLSRPSMSFVNDYDNIAIGCDFPGTDEYFEGIMDELAIFDEALDPFEVEKLYQMGAARVRE